MVGALWHIGCSLWLIGRILRMLVQFASRNLVGPVLLGSVFSVSLRMVLDLGCIHNRDLVIVILLVW